MNAIPTPPSQAGLSSWPDLFRVLADGPLAHDPAWLLNLRRSAIACFSDRGLPTPQDEEWRYTSLSPLGQWPVRLAPEPARDTRVALDNLPFAPGRDAHRLVFLNSRFQPRLSTMTANFGDATPVSLAESLRLNASGLEPHLARHANADEDAVVAWNTALFGDGAFLVIPAGQRLEKPIHILYLADATEPGWAVFPRTLILAEAGSEAVVVEHYASLNSTPAFVNAVTEIVLQEGAVLEHARLQDHHSRTWQLATVQAVQAARSVWKSHSVSLGAQLARQQIRTRLAGQGAESLLNGLYVAHEDQLVDHHTAIDHSQPHCQSHQFYHGILAGHATGVFNGKIFVRPGAQKTDAKQTNRNLLLSEDATVDTKPQLEIFADDVKCTHGATVGHLDEEPLFYLRSRGIGREAARHLLIHAFASEVINRIGVPQLRHALDQFLLGRWNPSASEPKGAKR